MLSAGALGLGFVQFASAADMLTKAPALAPVAYPWSGFYLGLSAGIRSADRDWDTTAVAAPFGAGGTAPDPGTRSRSESNTSFRGGIYGGYNWQFAPTWVAGLEADIAWARNNTTTAGLPGAEGPTIDFPTLATDSVNTKAKWDGSLRARLGYLATPSILLYATGGVSWLDLEANATCTPGGWCVAIRNETFTQTRTGWTVGGGVEGFVWGSWLARAEYRYADYGTMTNTHSPARSISSPLA
jgi:outer membrane immunogenic protein